MRLPRLLEIGTALAATLLVGCSTMRPMVGYRVDLPVPTGNCVSDLNDLQESSRELASAYSWRAAYNRDAIYAGGVLLLATAAATAGLGAAGAAGLSIALLGVSGGFVSGSMLLFHNADLANAYTIAEKAVNDALADPDSVPADPNTPGAATIDCARHRKLLKAVTDAKNALESARTTIAQGVSNTDIPAVKTQIAAISATLAATPAATRTPPKPQ